MMRWMLAALMLPCAALAEDWHGIWSADPAWCVHADRIGSVTPAPILLSKAEMLGYENSCEIVTVTEITELNAWKIQTTCFSEGDSYEDARLVMIDGDTMFMWFGGEEPIRFDRCPS
ncbi:MAG: hypothetical protein AB8B82_03855 [Roseovarius sp.]